MLTVENLKKTFANITAVDGVSFVIQNTINAKIQIRGFELKKLFK